MTATETEVKPITYPARPVNGGSLEFALPVSGEWWYESKLNGWRALVHVPTRTMFNRQGKRLSIEAEFEEALDVLQSVNLLADMEWVDCEALERRHAIARGTLIVLDLPMMQAPYLERIHTLHQYLEPLEVGKPLNGIRALCLHPEKDGMALWTRLQAENKRLGCDWAEGVVAKRADSIYPLQLRSPDVEFAFWRKHRWGF
mgnify:CR=1 FL=1